MAKVNVVSKADSNYAVVDGVEHKVSTAKAMALCRLGDGDPIAGLNKGLTPEDKRQLCEWAANDSGIDRSGRHVFPNGKSGLQSILV